MPFLIPNSNKGIVSCKQINLAPSDSFCSFCQNGLEFGGIPGMISNNSSQNVTNIKKIYI